VCAFEPPRIPDQRQREIVNELKKYFAEIDAHRKDVPDEEAEEIIDAALRSTRPN